jgi:hypothetical protein
MQAGQAVGAFGDSSMTVGIDERAELWNMFRQVISAGLLLLFKRENRPVVLSQAAIEDSVDWAEGIRPNCRDAKSGDLKTGDLRTGDLRTGL